MKAKQLFKTHLLPLVVFCSMVLAAVSCANEDIVQNNTGSDDDKNFTEFVGGRPETRTTMDYNDGAFYWEAGDKIYVQDDNNVWQVSNNAPTGKVASFKFKVPGKFTDKASYKVYYPGKNGSNNNVTIPTTQNQTVPNSTAHFGVSGDCGTADAARANNFHFTLEHQAAILVFQPYTDSGLSSCYVSKIEVSSDNNIAGSYTLNPGTGNLTGTGSDKQIILNITGSGAYADGFPLVNGSANVAVNGSYMLINPGEHTLRVRYWVKDNVTNVEGIITKALPSFNYDKNTFYDLEALLIKDFSGSEYYMWDAKKSYWYGHEWNASNPTNRHQPTANGINNANYPQSKITDFNRWYNDSNPGKNLWVNAQTDHFKSLPNVNEMAWYCKKGEPHWDADVLWATMGHLYKGAMWFKKKNKISGFNDTVSPDGQDYRTTGNNLICENSTIINSVPSASEINDYFLLPALGHYNQGTMNFFGIIGNYWSSTAIGIDAPGTVDDTRTGTGLGFRNNKVWVFIGYRYFGARIESFK